MSSALFVVVVLLGLIIFGFPISFSLGVTGLALLYKLDMAFMLELLPQRMFSGVNSFVIMAMPFFMLAGSIMNRTGITNALVRFAESCIGWVRGGLAHVNIVGSILFAGLTGSAVADTAALGSALIPAMKKAGYSKEFSAAVTAASSVIGPIIPPSIIMVIYGSLMNVSIAGLFVAGFFPGLLFGFSLIGVTYVIAKKRGYPKQDNFSLNELGSSFVKSLPALMMPVIILGGILGGISTPTEAAGVAVLYAIVIGVIFRKLSLKDLWLSLEETVLSQGMILLILSCAGILSWLMASEKIPDQIAEAILSITENKYVLL
ncbi:MAG: TRAP transporter large permease, partial [Rhodospirillales bacterium]|nr:TRAP transporter large permease [Rhodospirillales bacterium]